MKTKIKVVKPVDSMMDFKYICPNKNCNFDHWVTLREIKTKNFIIACECGQVFKPKQIHNIELHYEKPEAQKEKIVLKFVRTREQISPIENKEEFDIDIKEIDRKTLKEAVSTLLKFGFDKAEASAMIREEYEKTKSNNPAILVKNSLDFFGVKNG